MAKISFSQKPQRVYYSYKSDKCIYSITAKKPEQITDDGGCYCCYFECDAYHLYTYTKSINGETKTITAYGRIFEFKNGEPFAALTSGSFYDSTKTYGYYGYDNGGTSESYKTLSVPAVYYVKSGKQSFSWPNNSGDLPSITYPKSGDNKKTYYVDKLITNGAEYDKSTHKFTPLDVNGTSGATTFAYLVKKLVEDSININAFVIGVNEVPEYLRGGHKHVATGAGACANPCPFNEGEYDGSAYTATGSASLGSYSLSKDYLSVFGPLFMEKLCDVMKEKGDAIIEKYKENTIKTKYQDAVIEKPSTYTAGTSTTVTYQISEKSASGTPTT